MSGNQVPSESGLHHEIQGYHQEVLARCFAGGGKGDEALARQYAHLLREIARLPRERVLALRFLPEMHAPEHPPAPAHPSPPAAHPSPDAPAAPEAPCRPAATARRLQA